MGIVAEDIARVKESADLVALISEHVPLKRSGRRYSGCCPFHEEKTPSFSVNPEMGFYYCFGCGKKGDAITFMRDYLQMDFADAVESLAKKANIALRYDNNAAEKKSDLQPLYDCLDSATDYYCDLLRNADSAKLARQYIRSRGFGKDAVELFSIGYSPDSYDALANHLSSKFDAKTLIEAGLCYKNSRGHLNDVFRNRIMFPIKNASGATIGFGARTLDGTPPKYKNTGETRLYKKSFVLYNIDKAKSHAVKAGSFVVCEGYTDVIAMALSGVEQAVATCGTAATLDHVKIMSKYINKIIICFDMDSAGQKATERWLEFLGETQADICVANMGSSKDPAEVYLDDPKLLAKAIDEAIPFLEFLISNTISEHGASSNVEERARVAKKVVEIIRNHPNQLVREGYVMQFAPTLGFEPDWFFEELKKKPGEAKPAPRTQQFAEPVVKPIIEDREPRQRELLRICVHEPHSVTSFIRADVFRDSTYREIFDALIENESIDAVIDSLSESSREVFNQILVEDIAHVEEISPYSLDVFSRVVIAQMKEFLHQLVAQSAEDTAVVKKLLDAMTTSLEKGDSHMLIQSANELLDLRVKLSAR